MPLERVQFLQQCYPLPFLLDRGLQSGVPAVTRRRMPPTSSSAKHLRNLGAKANLSSFFPFILSSSFLCSLPFSFYLSCSLFSLLPSLPLISPAFQYWTPGFMHAHALFLPSYFEVSVQ